MVDGLAEPLLRRHVVARTEHHADFRERANPSLHRDLGDAEVEHFHEVGIPVLLDENDIFRLEVTVHDVPSVRGGEP
jgi:hypothetical protein